MSSLKFFFAGDSFQTIRGPIPTNFRMTKNRLKHVERKLCLPSKKINSKSSKNDGLSKVGSSSIQGAHYCIQHRSSIFRSITFLGGVTSVRLCQLCVMSCGCQNITHGNLQPNSRFKAILCLVGLCQNPVTRHDMLILDCCD